MSSSFQEPSNSFEELYDDETIDALEAWSAPLRPEPERRPASTNAHRRAGPASAGILAASMMRGLAEVFEDDEETSVEIIEVLPTISGGPNERVTLFYVPHDPHATVAIIRPDR